MLWYVEGNPRGWQFSCRIPLGSIWISTSKSIEIQNLPSINRTQYLLGVREVREDGNRHLEMRIAPSYACQKFLINEENIWYTRTAEERERFIGALHRALEEARRAWFRHWQIHPPVPGDRQGNLINVHLPAPEKIYFSARGRQYTF
jgi:hypothetical protein